MKRKTTLLAVGLASALGFTSVAIAADATLYGSVRSGVVYQKPDGGEATWDLGSVDAGDLGSGDKLWSRIGVRASHDLGNGMTGGLHLEKRLDNFRTRHQNVYLSGAFGKVTLGQQGGVYHAARTWDGTNLFGGNADLGPGSRLQGISYSSMLAGPFSFSAMITDDGSTKAAVTDCHVENPARCQHVTAADVMMAKAEDVELELGALKRLDDDGKLTADQAASLVPIDGATDGSGNGFDSYEMAVSYSTDVATVALGYAGDQGADEVNVFGGTVGGSVTGFDWKVGYEKESDGGPSHYGAFVSYAGAYAYYEGQNQDLPYHFVIGYSRSLGTNTWLILEHLTKEDAMNKTALALRVDF